MYTEQGSKFNKTQLELIINLVINHPTNLHSWVVYWLCGWWNINQTLKQVREVREDGVMVPDFYGEGNYSIHAKSLWPDTHLAQSCSNMLTPTCPVKCWNDKDGGEQKLMNMRILTKWSGKLGKLKLRTKVKRVISLAKHPSSRMCVSVYNGEDKGTKAWRLQVTTIYDFGRKFCTDVKLQICSYLHAQSRRVQWSATHMVTTGGHSVHSLFNGITCIA